MTETLTIIGIYLIGMFISFFLWFKWNPTEYWNPTEQKRRKELAECANTFSNPQSCGDFFSGILGATVSLFDAMGCFVLSVCLSLLSYVSIALFLILHVFYYVKYKLS